MAFPANKSKIAWVILQGLVQWLIIATVIYLPFYIETRIFKSMGLGLSHLEWRIWFPLLLFAAGMALPVRWRWYGWGLLSLAYNFLLFGDKVYMRFFDAPPTFSTTAAISQIPYTIESLAALVESKDSLPFIVSIFFFIYGYLLNRFAIHQVFSKNKGRFFLAGLATIIAIVSLGLANKKPYNNGKPAFERDEIRYSRIYYIRFIGLYTYHAVDLWQWLSDPGEELNPEPEHRNLVDQLVEERYQLNKTTSPLFGIAANRNVICIQMEAWQHFLLGLKVNDLEVVPYMNQIADDALVWDRIMDITCLGRTSDAEFSFLTGLMPDCGRVTGMSHAHNDLLGLPAALAEKGYNTISFHGYRKFFWNRAELHPSLGIQKMFFQREYPPKRVGWGVPDDVFFETNADVLRDLQSPFFAFMISLTCHHPFLDLPEIHSNWEFGLTENPISNGYLKLSRFADEGLATFMQKLSQSKLDQQSIILIYGDHDAGIRKDDLAVLSEASGKDLSQIEEDRVPVYILIPGKEAEIRSHREAFRNIYGGLHDLYPTLLHLLGIESPKGIMGTHLFVANEARDTLPLPLYNALVDQAKLRKADQLDPTESELKARAISIEALNRLLLRANLQGALRHH